jgi:hypothetical protein
LSSIAPYLSVSEIATPRADLATVARARANLSALRERHAQPAGSCPCIDALVREYPAIDGDMTGMIDRMSAPNGNWQSWPPGWSPRRSRWICSTARPPRGRAGQLHKAVGLPHFPLIRLVLPVPNAAVSAAYGGTTPR